MIEVGACVNAGFFFSPAGWGSPAGGALFCLATKETKMPGARLLGDLLALNGEIKRTRLRLRHLLILRHLQTAGARLAIDGAGKRNGLIIFSLLAQR